MKQKRHITGFYIETLLLIVVLISIILVITNIFGLARVRSAQARHLTKAVTLAQNAAEAAAASASIDEAAAILDENGNVTLSEDGESLSACYDSGLTPAADGIYRILMHWQEEEALANCQISVFHGGTQEPVYTLETSVYVGDKEVRD